MFKLQHNVVSLLYTIKGHIEAHLGRYEEKRFGPGEDPLTHAHQVMRKIHRQADRALAITKRISLAMKAEDDSAGVIGKASVKEVWREMLLILGKRYSFEAVEIIEYIPDDFPLIQCRRNDLLEIFYTLVRNAVQAMSAAKSGTNRKLIIRANLQYAPGDHILAVITVSDTGPGMEREILTNIFEPFFTTKDPKEGSGLGLCLARSLVRRNEGTIAVSSFKNSGTTFILNFRVAPAPEGTSAGVRVLAA
ncbi:MAG: hypothetical protein A2Z83_00400 [Omnitrophica bacterium GWA2_52_8]|nr:MAG: hypothetical protein A2Z83_00400 [Omnitrophica bacterium GWA2_52_8]